MGANDDILADGTPDPGKPAGGEAKPAAIDPAAVRDAVKTEIAQFEQQFGGRLNQFSQELGRYVQDALKGAQAPQPKDTSAANLTQELLNDPQKAIRGLIDEWAKDALGPYLTTQVTERFDELLDKQRVQIDKRWGEGAFDTIVRPEVAAVVEKTPNASAKASQQYVSAAVAGTIGREAILDKLIAHKAEIDTKRAKEDADVATDSVLDAGRPRRRAPAGELDEESKAFLAAHSRATGVEHNMKRLAEIMRVRDKAGFIDSQNMPGVKNKLPVKGSRHRQTSA